VASSVLGGLALTGLALRSELPVVAQLGPLGAWHCLHGPTYRYDPRHERPDGALLVETPEAVVDAAHPDVQVERIELDLRTGEAVVWSKTTAWVAQPAELKAVWTERGLACQSHLRGWIIVAEHALG
jgi:hypothetical protein